MSQRQHVAYTYVAQTTGFICVFIHFFVYLEHFYMQKLCACEKRKK